MTHPNILGTCKLFGCTIEQAKAQFKANAKQLRESEAKARMSANGKFRGCTADKWAMDAAKFELIAG